MDIWALGCVLAEIIQATYREREMKNRFLFPGTSCFPLSPCEQMKKSIDKSVNIVSSSDQLKKILQILGPQMPQDLAFITDDSAVEYHKSISDNQV